MSGKPPAYFEFSASDLMVKVDTTIPAMDRAVLPVMESIMSVIKETGCSAGREFEIEQSLLEALNNAIEHGSAHDPSKLVQCIVSCDKARGMLIVVRDQGPGFDPSSIPSPVIGQNIYSEGGRGIYLINQLMDEVQFQKGGTEIHMRIKPQSEC
jgi:serine/threonine-protein kinase RsbW